MTFSKGLLWALYIYLKLYSPHNDSVTNNKMKLYSYASPTLFKSIFQNEYHYTVLKHHFQQTFTDSSVHSDVHILYTTHGASNRLKQVPSTPKSEIMYTTAYIHTRRTPLLRALFE